MCLCICRKKQQRSRRGSLGGGSEKAGSVSELSLGGLSSRAGRGPASLWGRDLAGDARPITNPALRNKLGAARTPGTKVTSRVSDALRPLQILACLPRLKVERPIISFTHWAPALSTSYGM